MEKKEKITSSTKFLKWLKKEWECAFSEMETKDIIENLGMTEQEAVYKFQDNQTSYSNKDIKTILFYIEGLHRKGVTLDKEILEKFQKEKEKRKLL